MAEFPKHKQPSGTYRLSREATSHLRTDVHHATADARPKIILVTSAAAGEGKTSVALSLATSFAINQIRTLLIEADMRRPVLGHVLNLSPIHHHPLQRHLENPFETEGRYTPASVAVNATDKLDVVPTFEPTASPAELLSYGFSACLKKWGEAYDVIIIDSPPVLPVADALTIAPLCTGAILVASMKRSDRRQVQTALSLLQRHGVRVLGTVANRVSAPPRGEAYGYAYEVNEPYPAPLPKLKDKEAGKLQG
jgi:capsular exopolysaccharide synthesis family protein